MYRSRWIWLFRVSNSTEDVDDIVQLFKIDVKKYSCGLLTFVNADNTILVVLFIEV